MSYSPLKYKIEEAKARHEHEKFKLAKEHTDEMKKLLAQCTHKYEDGSSATHYWEGHHRMDYGRECNICGSKNI
ncbi:MAG: hypothetical protein K0R18_223 [Bacillales bacterium]|nr:hypothetical protein [Bacillales bacterium]